MHYTFIASVARNIPTKQCSICAHSRSHQKVWCNNKGKIPRAKTTAVLRSEAVSAAIPSCIPQEAAFEITDEYARALMQDVQVIALKTSFCQSLIDTSYIETGPRCDGPVLIFLHSFDSSLLEFRRIWPLLKHANCVAYAVDILGWGFTSKPESINYSVEEKRDHLLAFIQHVVRANNQIVLVGASVGGAAAIDFSLAYPHLVSKLVLIGPQAFGEKKADPILQAVPPLRALAASILRAKWLRRIAVNMSYVSAEFRSEETVRIGRLHTLTPGWQSASEKFIAGDGYCLADDVPNIACPVLVIYGTEDKILPSKEYSERFASELRCGYSSVAVPSCGHSPHIEKAQVTASVILDWLNVST